MEFNTQQAKELVNVLLDNGFAQFADEIQKQIDEKAIRMGKLYEIINCNHEWGYSDRPGAKYNLEEYLKALKKSSIPDEDKQKKEAVAKYFARCTKCGLSHRLKDLNLRSAADRMEQEYTVYINASGSDYWDFIYDEENRQKELGGLVSEEMDMVKEDIKWLKENCERLPKKEARDQLDEIAKKLADLEGNHKVSV